MISGTWNVNSIPKDAPNLKWKVALLPYTKKPASSLGGENWAMFASSKQKDGAWAFLKFVVDPAYGTKLTDCMGYIPSRKDVLAQVAAKSANDPTMLVFLKQMESAAARGPLPNWPEVSAYRPGSDSGRIDRAEDACRCHESRRESNKPAPSDHRCSGCR